MCYRGSPNLCWLQAALRIPVLAVVPAAPLYMNASEIATLLPVAAQHSLLSQGQPPMGWHNGTVTRKPLLLCGPLPHSACPQQLSLTTSFERTRPFRLLNTVEVVRLWHQWHTAPVHSQQLNRQAVTPSAMPPPSTPGIAASPYRKWRQIHPVNWCSATR